MSGKAHLVHMFDSTVVRAHVSVGRSRDAKGGKTKRLLNENPSEGRSWRLCRWPFI
jgi:hypothetical protein